MKNKLCQLRELVRFGEKQFEKADLYFGHGTATAWDEAAYLALHALNLSPDTPLNISTEFMF